LDDEERLPDTGAGSCSVADVSEKGMLPVIWVGDRSAKA
jgi:hypothetical protein